MTAIKIPTYLQLLSFLPPTSSSVSSPSHPRLPLVASTHSSYISWQSNKVCRGKAAEALTPLHQLIWLATAEDNTEDDPVAFSSPSVSSFREPTSGLSSCSTAATKGKTPTHCNHVKMDSVILYLDVCSLEITSTCY